MSRLGRLAVEAVSSEPVSVIMSPEFPETRENTGNTADSSRLNPRSGSRKCPESRRVRPQSPADRNREFIDEKQRSQQRNRDLRQVQIGGSIRTLFPARGRPRTRADHAYAALIKRRLALLGFSPDFSQRVDAATSWAPRTERSVRSEVWGRDRRNWGGTRARAIAPTRRIAVQDDQKAAARCR